MWQNFYQNLNSGSFFLNQLNIKNQEETSFQENIYTLEKYILRIDAKEGEISPAVATHPHILIIFVFLEFAGKTIKQKN